MLAVGIALVGLACTPIPAPPRDDGPLEIGDRLPALLLRTAEGAAARLPGPDEGPLVLTLVRPHEDARAALGRELMDKLERVRRTLAPKVRGRARFHVLLLDDPAGRPPPAWVSPSREWRVIAGPESEIRELATRLRVLVWNGGEELPGQTFMTVVADASGVIRARLSGLDSWSERDLIGTIVEADSF